MSEKKSIPFGNFIGLAAGIISFFVAQHYVKSFFRGDVNNEKSNEQIINDLEGLIKPGKIVKVDILQSGNFIVDGAELSLEELDSLLESWKSAESIVSIYAEPSKDGVEATDVLIENPIINSKILVTTRRIPQKR